MGERLHAALAWTISREWLGLAAGALLVALAPAAGSKAAIFWVLGLLGLILLVGGSVHLARLCGARWRFPPPGRRVDIGGCRVHLLAEGEARGALPVIWFGGGHAAGLVMQHLHDALKQETRSILIDRPGTGWSDTGPFPRTTAREAEEMVRALHASGERGPFVFAGYSFGGLLAANIARRHPELVGRLVLIDPTPLETLVFGPRLGAIRDMRRDALLSALVRYIGLATNFQERRVARTPGHAEMTRDFVRVLGPALDTLKAVEIGAGPRVAEWSIYRELLGPHIAGCGWETVVYDGDLGDLSVWLVAPGSSEELHATPEVADASGGEAARMLRFFQRTRERYLATSSNARRIYAPPGATHQFVYQMPEFLIETMRAAVRP